MAARLARITTSDRRELGNRRESGSVCILVVDAIFVHGCMSCDLLATTDRDWNRLVQRLHLGGRCHFRTRLHVLRSASNKAERQSPWTITNAKKYPAYI